MALQIRRGTDAERLTITPAEGELIYTTDTKILYVGDGSTVGGTKTDTGILSVLEDTTPQLGGPLDLNSQNITGVGNINTSGNITATGVVSSASGVFTAATIGLGTGNFKGTFAADDSTILIDGLSGKVNLAPNSIDDIGDVSVPAPNNGDVLQWDGGLLSWIAGPIGTAGLEGNFTGSFFADDSSLKIDGISGTVYGPFEGDLSGSVFADNSSLLVDGVNSSVNLTNTFTSGDATLTNSNTGDFTSEIQTQDGFPTLDFTRTSESDISAVSTDYGRILFSRNDTGGKKSTALILGGQDFMALGVDPTGVFSGSNIVTLKSGNLGVGIVPTSKLHVDGNTTITGTVEAASFKGSYAIDDSTTIIDGITGTITSAGFVQFGGYSTAERDALTAANGMVIYNTSLNVFQGYQNSAWVTFTTS